MRISDWSSDVCSSDLHAQRVRHGDGITVFVDDTDVRCIFAGLPRIDSGHVYFFTGPDRLVPRLHDFPIQKTAQRNINEGRISKELVLVYRGVFLRSEEHTSELQSLMRTSYAVF